MSYHSSRYASPLPRCERGNPVRVVGFVLTMLINTKPCKINSRSDTQMINNATRIHTCIYTHTHTYILVWGRTNIEGVQHTHPIACLICILTYAYTHACKCKCIKSPYVNLHSYTMYINTHTHINIYKHMHI